MSSSRTHNWIPRAPRLARALALAATMALLACPLARLSPTPQRQAAGFDCFEHIVQTLASDDLEGRGIATAGLEAAAAFLTDEFRRAGLEPGAEGYRQNFQAITGVEPGPGNELRWDHAFGRLGHDYTPLGFSSSGSFDGPLVFAGYGTRAAELGYDDYAGLDVRGKVVLAWRYEPGERDPDSPFDGPRPTRWSDLRYKAHVAREAGAAALILATPPDAEGTDDPEAHLPPIRASGPLSAAGLPVLQVSRGIATAWLARAGHSARALHEAIDADYQPRSFPVQGLEISGRVDLETHETTVSNIVGVLPGSAELAVQTIVVGAHYDHLGLGGSGSMVPETRAIHNGADDNASGVAALVCGARALVQKFRKTEAARRTLLVIAFTAEEIGLAGSTWYLRHPLRPLAGTMAMVNLDMVGRLRNDRLFILGTDSSPGWLPILERQAANAELAVEGGGDGYGPSDQLPFYQQGIPVAHLFTGSHPEYHTPLDDFETLNTEGGTRIAAFLADILSDLLQQAAELSFTPAESGPFHLGDSRGYGSYLGTIPDMSEMLRSEGGVRLAGVREGAPAHAAGLQSDDRIVRMAGVEIRNLFDMTFVLREHRPGEVIEIEVQRGSERFTTAATLGRRGAEPDPTGAPPDPGSPEGEERGYRQHGE